MKRVEASISEATTPQRIISSLYCRHCSARGPMKMARANKLALVCTTPLKVLPATPSTCAAFSAASTVSGCANAGTSRGAQWREASSSRTAPVAMTSDPILTLRNCTDPLVPTRTSRRAPAWISSTAVISVVPGPMPVDVTPTSMGLPSAEYTRPR